MVGGLQVTVNDALFVCGFQRFGDLLGEREGLIGGKWTTGDPLGERFPFDKLHDQEGLAFRFLDFIESGRSRDGSVRLGA